MRAFIAIELPQDIRKGLREIQEELKKTDADVKWVKPENVHLTLKFLGNVADEKIKKIKSLLEEISSGYSKFEASVFKIGAFPKLEYPRVIWVGIDKGCNLLEEIAVRIEDECEHIGFAKEKRAFSAHLTLGRVRTGKNKIALKEKLLSAAVPQQSFIVDKIILFQSTLTPKGPIYTPLHSSILSLH